MTPATPRPADRIGIEDLFALPAREHATISPDGARIAYLAPWQDRLNVWIEPIDGSAAPRRVTADQTRGIMHYSWTDDPRWMLYLQDSGGDENYHIYRVDLFHAEADAVDVTPFPGARAAFEVPGDSPGTAFVFCNNRLPDRIDVHRLDIVTGNLTLLAENPGHVAGWLVSRSGAMFGFAVTIRGDVELLQWDVTTSTTRSIVSFEGADYPLGIFPMLVTPDGTGIWLGSHEGSDRTRLVRLDVQTGEQIVVDAHPWLCIDPRAGVSPSLPHPLITHPRTGDLIGVRYLGERQVIHALNPHFAQVLQRIQALSDGDLGVLSCDDDASRWIVNVIDDRNPRIYVYDHDTGESRLLARMFPHLDPRRLAPMSPVEVRARDGLALPSYLTLPVGVERQNLALVVLVHGGPWFRDAWGFDPGVQMLANRGHAVLQVNFRGSTGYGKSFTKAAIGQFAGAMHDDLIDAVGWAVDAGYADPDRVAIFGASYGGYAALVGAAFTPEVFAAAIDYVGVSDLSNFLRTLPEVARPHLANNWHLFVGDPERPDQLADMLSRSPIGLVENISVPLLVLQGANDSRVVRAESDNLVSALRRRGAEVEYVVKDDEGHGFINPNNVVDLWHVVDQFLAKHLAQKPSEPLSDRAEPRTGDH